MEEILTLHRTAFPFSLLLRNTGEAYGLHQGLGLCGTGSGLSPWFLQVRTGLLNDVTGALWRLCMPQDYRGLGSVPGFGCREQQLRGFESDAGFTPMETLKRNRAPSSQNNPHNRIQPCICICMCIYIGILYIYIYIYIYICLYLFVYLFMYKFVYIFYVLIYVCIYVCIYIHI